jgi:hypothetical protein
MEPPLGAVQRISGVTASEHSSWKHEADWTDRIAAGERPSSVPARAQSLEEGNVVVSVREGSDDKGLCARPVGNRPGLGASR